MRKNTQPNVAEEKPQLVAVTPSIWNALQSEILKIEDESFPPSLADSEKDLCMVVYSPTGIFLVLSLTHSHKVIGYIAADLLENFPDIPGTDSDPQFKKGNTVYIESVAVHSDWRGCGLGSILIRECLRLVSQKGIERVTAHIESGSVSRIGLGARVLKSFENWYGTGRTFDYVEFPIER